MTEHPTIEELGGHSYLVHGEQDGEAVDVRVVVDPGFVAGLGLSGVSGARVVDAALAFLLRHQRLDELPVDLDLEDAAAAYDGFEAHLRTQLASAS